MRIGALDIETAPATALVWRTGNQYVSLGQIETPPRMISFAWRWEDMPAGSTIYASEWDDGHETMVRLIADLLDQADAVLHFNGKSFDMPWINTEIKKAGLPQPSPYVQIDLYRQTRKKFWLVSHKLQAVTTQLLDLEGKVPNEGLSLWRKVLAGDEAARRRFRRYNIRDVDLLVKAFRELRPWLDLPFHAGVVGEDGDPKSCGWCGGTKLERRGWAYTKQSKYARYHCLNPKCGKWLRGTRRELGAEYVGVAA